MLISSLITVKLEFDNSKECKETKVKYEEKDWKIWSYGSSGNMWYFNAKKEYVNS